MTPRNFDGAIYSAAIAGGECFGVFPDRIETLTGTRIPSCPGGGPLAPQAARVNGKLCLAGKGHADGLAWLWNGSDWLPLCPSHGGMNTCAFGPLGVYVSTPTGEGNVRIFDALTGAEFNGLAITNPLGVEGIALVTGSGVSGLDIHPTKDWYGRHGFGFYTEFATFHGLIRIGQGANGGLVAKIDDGPNKLLEAGDWQFITVDNVGDVFSVAASQFPLNRAAVRWFSVADIRNAPDVTAPVPDPQPDPEPEPIPVALIAPNQKAVVARMIAAHPEINTKDEQQRGRILDYVCHELGGKPWGRKARRKDGTNLNTDGLTYRRQDNLFEIYDVIGGSSGAATWTGYGPFRDGENGYWTPGLPVSDVPDEPEPDPEPPPDGVPDTPEKLWNLFVKFRAMDQQNFAELEERMDKRLKAVEGPRKVALRTDNGRYVCAEGGGSGEVNATRESVGAWETFTVEPQEN